MKPRNLKQLGQFFLYSFVYILILIFIDASAIYKLLKHKYELIDLITRSISLVGDILIAVMILTLFIFCLRKRIYDGWIFKIINFFSFILVIIGMLTTYLSRYHNSGIDLTKNILLMVVGGVLAFVAYILKISKELQEEQDLTI